MAFFIISDERFRGETDSFVIRTFAVERRALFDVVIVIWAA